MKKWKIIIFCGVCLQWFLMACSGRGTETHIVDDSYDRWKSDSASLRVAVMPTLDCLPLFVAEAEGLFDNQGVNVSLYQYDAQMDCDTAIESGWVEVMATDLVRVEYLKQKGLALDYLTATELHWQLLAGQHTKVKRLSQLEHKMIAMTRFSATAMLADMLVDTAAVMSDYVFRIQVNDVNVRYEMLNTQVMDVMFLPEPYATAARQLDAHLLYDTHWDDVRMGVLAIRQEAMADTLRRHQAEGLLKAYDAACDSINRHGLGHYSALIAECSGFSHQVTDSLSADILFSPSAQPRQTDIDKARLWFEKQGHHAEE
jgi:NitT/TauT family transport system substrate-binding protein